MKFGFTIVCRSASLLTMLHISLFGDSRTRGTSERWVQRADTTTEFVVIARPAHAQSYVCRERTMVFLLRMVVLFLRDSVYRRRDGHSCSTTETAVSLLDE